MFYRIEYGPPGPRSRDKLPLRLIGLTCMFFAMFILGVKAAWPAGSEKLTQLLLPAGDRAGFLDAAQVFISDLKAGAPFYDSLTAFCHQIISYADIPAA